MKKVRVAIVGSVRGMCLAQAFMAHKESELVAVCDIREQRAKKAVKPYGDIKACSDYYDEILNDDNINAVFIATPDSLHAPMTIAALKAGKHVLSEVPLGTTVDECKEIIRLSVSANLKVEMGNECRWMPYLEAIKQYIDQGRLGEIFYGEGDYMHNLLKDGVNKIEDDDSLHWRWNPDDPMTTMLPGGMHPLDTLRWLMGVEQFTEVCAFGNRKAIKETDADDTTAAIFKDKNGIIAKITSTYGVWRPYCLYFGCYGTEGSFETDRSDNKGEALVYLKDIKYQEKMMSWPVPIWEHPDSSKYELYHGTTDIHMGFDFIDAIVKDRQPIISAKEGAISTVAAICALESAKTGSVVKIPQF